LRATFLGFTVPGTVFQQILTDDQVMPTQTHKFAWAFVDALQQNGVEVDLLSAAPVSNYPSSSHLVWPMKRFVERGATGLLLPFVNALVLKHLTRFVACVVLGTRRIRRHRSQWLLVHGVHSPFLWYAIYARRRTGVRLAAVLSDPPGVMRRSDGRVARSLKRIDIGVTKGALRHFDAVIALSEPLADDFAPGVPKLLMEGLFMASTADIDVRPEPVERPRIVYAGGLMAEYGVLNLARAVSESDMDVTLELYGRGDAAEELSELSRRDDRIGIPVLLEPTELARRYRGARALIQPRQPDQDFVRYSFPSKLIEYMSTGVPVVSTRLPSIPSDYSPHLLWAESATPFGLRQAIGRCLALTPEEAERLGRGAAEFVTSRSPAAQGRRIVNFLVTRTGG